MKTVAEKDQHKEGTQKPVKHTRQKNEELETDGPLSEKDEVKKAESKMNEFRKKHP